MANKTNRNPLAFTPILLDQETHEKRRVIKQLPAVHQTDTLQKFFGASADNLFDPGKGKPINGYVGQKPLWYDPDQDYYLEESTDDRTFYQLEASMVSKNTEGQLTDLLPYPDLINQLRFQGALVNNHNRLFSQDFYTWCPPVDLDKIVNFRQYVWLPLSDIPADQAFKAATPIYGPTSITISTGQTNIYDLPGYGATDPDLAQWYQLSDVTAQNVIALVDGQAKPFTYTAGQQVIKFTTKPATDAVVQISVFSDLENNAVGLTSANPKAFGGVALSSGMRISIQLDNNTDYAKDDIWIVEGVGQSIFLIKETAGGTTDADYMVLARGSKNENEWSVGNRWFHSATLPVDLDPDFVLEHRASRPIIEFKSELELYNYGTIRRLPVDIVVENIEDLNAALNLTPQSVTLDGITVTTQGSDKIHLTAINPDTGVAYGTVESIRLMIRNTVNELLNNNIFVLVNQGNALKLILETDGADPSGNSVFGEVFRVRLGTYQGKNLHWDGSNWIAAQAKTSVNQAPLFELYDLNGLSLKDTGAYPNSTFLGSKIFNYQVDDTGTRAADTVLGIPLVHDAKGQILFENFIHTQTYQYVVGGKFLDIEGFYFHSDDGYLSNDWYKAAQKTRQFMVDRYVSDSKTKLFKMSQTADELTVTIGRVGTNNSYERIELIEDTDFIRIDRNIMIFEVTTGDIIEIRSFNPLNPPLDATGHYEVPLNLQANPDNDQVTLLTKGDFYDHFSEIIKSQVGFTGAEYANNNYRDTAKATNLGTHIIQHSASLLKTMLLAGSTQLDLTSAIRYSDSEYAKFKAKFLQKVLGYVIDNRLSSATPFDTWISTALDDINKGKTKSFAFYLSGMARTDSTALPTFIPATPSYLGIYPLYQPQSLQDSIMNDDGAIVDVWFVRGHDGAISQIEDATVAAVYLALEQRIFDSVPANIRNQERPVVDFATAHGDQYRINDYSYDEWLQILRPSFERWAVAYDQDYRANTQSNPHDPWSWNWSSQGVPGHWRGIYEKFFGTQRPDMTPWESLGFTIQPDWWQARYGAAPYTSDNLVLWNDIVAGYIHEGSRQGINAEWARPGLADQNGKIIFMPVDGQGRLRHPGPRNLQAFTAIPQTTLTFRPDPQAFNSPEEFEAAMEAFEYDPQSFQTAWSQVDGSNPKDYQVDDVVVMDGLIYICRQSHTATQSFEDDTQTEITDPSKCFAYDLALGRWQITDIVLGCGICSSIPLPTDRNAEWNWGDVSPVEQSWRLSSAYGFAVATASYLMKPASFVELGWNTKDLALYFTGTPNEQYMDQDTMGRPQSASLQVHGEVLDDFSLVTKVGIQQWLSDYLVSSNTSVNTALADKVRGLGTQLSYKAAGFTDSSTLVVVSDAFGRVPSEDVSVNLYRSPSIREEVYSGVAISWTGRGYEVYGYDALDPYFSIIPGNPYGSKTSVGSGAASASVPGWRANTYYSVNITVKYGDNFYRALKTHTSSAYFDEDQPNYWVQVARPQYADGAHLVWLLESEIDPQVEQIAYGTVFKKPQDVADFLNGYERYLKSRGWSFTDVGGDNVTIQDWKDACGSFILWSQNENRAISDYIALSPSSRLVRFSSDQGAIQPIEQIVNGLYAIVDQNGQPIDNRKTHVVRSDGELTVSCDLNSKGIFGLRLYVSEYEHVLVFNNQTIFGDTIYNPLLNIHQPRLRIQGFKTMAWKGRIDAPGFIVTGDTLTPNFERAADDFRRFFASESMENKTLQDRARANFGYEEKDYLDNLLLTPTNQFEFYQGMIQQKGSPTSMRRLLRSNFIRNNKGLQLFEEWAFRVGDYGGQEVAPSLDIQISQSEFKNNPQLISFNQTETGTTIPTSPGTIQVVDLTNSQGMIDTFDTRWQWRPDMNQITWPVRDYSQEDVMPTAGFVKLDEVRFTLPTSAEFATLYNDQRSTDQPLQDRDRVWVYGIGEGDPQTSWMTYKFNDTSFQVIDLKAPAFDGQSVVAVLDKNLNLGGSQGYYLNQSDVQEQLILKDLTGSDISDRNNYVPKFAGSFTQDFANTSASYVPLITMMASPHMVVDQIIVNVEEKFADGSTLTIGHENQNDFFVQERQEVPRTIYPTNYTSETVLVQTPDTHYVGSTTPTADITLVRVGTMANVCGETVVTWTWVSGGNTTSGDTTFLRPSDYAPDSTEGTYQQVIQVPVTPGQSTTGTLTIEMNGQQTDQQTITVIPSNQSGLNFVDLTTPGTYPFTFNQDVNDIGAQYMAAMLSNAGAIGKMSIEVTYHYTKGFELTTLTDGQLASISTSKDGGTASLYTWINTRYPTFSDIPTTSAIWDNGDIVEVDDRNGLWAVYQYNKEGNGWYKPPHGSDPLEPMDPIRIQTRKINSDLLTNAAIYDSTDNELKMVLQLYDPAKGYIPGTADRELEYKMFNDPANYDESKTIWGKEQVGQLWWDQSTVRYLDYEIEDDVSTHGVNYRWKNWGRVAPNSSIDIYEWVRSTVAPSGWNDYVTSKANLKIDNKPTGTVVDPANTPFIHATEWNDSINADEVVYYFWVLNPTVTPLRPERQLSAQQVSNIIANPSAQDIPFFAVVDTNKVIVGGIKQYLSEQDTILKIKWNLDAEIHNNHHKQWIILREADERNTIDDPLWNKMRDSLVGWDATQAKVPDDRLPKAQQIGALVRPRQSWFPADPSPSGGQRPSRAARSAFVDILNNVLASAPFVDQWYDYDTLFNTGEAQPSSDLYVTTALDLVDLKTLLPAARNMVNPGECVFIENTAEIGGFWTLWQLVENNGVRSFILNDLQKWRMQEGELWNLVDWYGEGWSAKDFPNYRFSTPADRDAAGNLDVTLLKGTLVQIDHVDTDSRWTWDVYTSTTKYQVAKHNATMALGSAFYDDSRIEFGPKEVTALLAQNITPDQIQTIADLINHRDGSQELEFIINTLKTQFIDTIQKNTIFFSMVKSAFHQSKMIDWAFKTSFLYLGGYSEELTQSPVAFKDQIDNVISYLDEVKPYHVKIREYVRRLSYGPDVANLAMTDFDKPVYPDGKTNRILDVTNAVDQQIISQNRPWKDWYETYTNTIKDLKDWDLDWNGARRIKVGVKLDRISCGTTKGWDTSPWDPTLLVYSQLGETTRSLSQLSEQYRNQETDGDPDYYHDQAVETIEDRNYLVRNGIVTPDRPGTIVTILSDLTHWMWDGSEWLQFEAIGWDQDPDMGMASRIDSYRPLPGMIRKDDDNLIEGCGFDGTIITSAFQDGIWDFFEWDSTGLSAEISTRTGVDLDSVDGNTTPADESDPSNIKVEGNRFAQPAIDGNRPRELVSIRGIESLIINFKLDTNAPVNQKTVVNAKGNVEVIVPGNAAITYNNTWTPDNPVINVSVDNWVEDAQGYTPLHDPQNPSTGFIRDVVSSQAYSAQTTSKQSATGQMTFTLKDDLDVIPAGLVGDNVRVAILHPKDPSKRVMGTLTNSKGSESADWNGTLVVTVDAGSIDIGQSKTWNIIPADIFHEPGVVWIGNARFTYTSIEVQEDGSYDLTNAKLSASTLAPLDITDTSVALAQTSPVLDGSRQRDIR